MMNEVILLGKVSKTLLILWTLLINICGHKLIASLKLK